MKPNFNIIIPAININSHLLICLKELNKQNSKNFFVTVVLDFYNKKIREKLNYNLKIIVTGKKNMSHKRNLAAKRFKSRYVAFLDSDAYPNKNWLVIAQKYLIQKKADIVGGPSIPFPKKNFIQYVTYFSKRSYFVTGYQSFRKYKSTQRYCDWLESCNILMKRSFFLKYKMNEKVYIGEDKEFFERLRKERKNLKVYHCPKLYIFHDERNYNSFLLQRMSFGMDFINLINPTLGIKGFQSLLPFIVSLIYVISLINYFFYSKIGSELIYLYYFFLIFSIFVFFEIIFYIKKIKFIIPVFITIILANIYFALGSFLSVFGLKKDLVKSIYRKSQNIKNN